MRKSRGRLLLAITIWSGVVMSSSAQAPEIINYQGRLLNGTNLVNGNVGLSLRLFNVPSGGASIYEDSNSVAVVDGLYSTFIGDNTTSGSLAGADRDQRSEISELRMENAGLKARLERLEALIQTK